MKIKKIIHFCLKDKYFYYILFISLLMYIYLLHPDLAGKSWTDVKAHAGFVKQWIEVGFRITPMNFLYYLIVAIVGGFQASLPILGVASAIILSFSWALKYSISRYIIRDYLLNTNVVLSDEKEKYIKIVSLFLCFIAHIPLNTIVYDTHRFFYFGELSLNTWHNSTTIFMLPFSTLLFYFSYKKIFLQRKGYTMYINVLAVICFLIKPNFTLCFSPIYGILILYKYKLTREFWSALPAVIFPILLLSTQFITLFDDELGGRYAEENQGHVIISLFSGWNAQLLTNNFLTSFKFLFAFLGAYLLPIIYGVLYKKYSIIQKLAMCFVALALAIWIVLAETSHGVVPIWGNFLWQVIMCNYILFLVFTLSILEDLFTRASNSFDRKFLVVNSILYMHFLCGILYILYILINKSYF